MKIYKVWLKKDIIEWQNISSTWYRVEEQKWKRAYIIWEHSRKLIEKNNNEFDLADGITNLKRSLNHRLKLIEEIYKLKSIEINNKPKGYLELLERFGLVRPLIMKKLLLIRNDIEHNDATPPTLERCMELLDVLWYFLKSTDSLVQMAKFSAEFNMIDESGSETHYDYTIRIDFENKGQSIITGWFPSEYISEVFHENYIEIATVNFEMREEFYKTKDKHLHKDKSSSDIYLNGIPIFKSDEKYKIIPKVLYSL
jgi:hypothetical protein